MRAASDQFFDHRARGGRRGDGIVETEIHRLPSQPCHLEIAPLIGRFLLRTEVMPAAVTLDGELHKRHSQVHPSNEPTALVTQVVLGDEPWNPIGSQAP
jgi:hypothetical protein